MKDNKSYNYTDNFSDIIHTARFINAAELSGLFFSAPKWITILMKFRNIVVRSLGLKKERNLSDLVYIESENIATVCKNDKHLDLEIAFITESMERDSQRISVSTKVRFHNSLGKCYFAIIKPFHNLICKTLLQRAILPSHDAVSLITVLPEQLQSPLLTAEWEYRLGEIERGQLAPEEFLDGISTMLKDLVGTYQVIKGTEYLFTPPREVVGKCPRCGGEVAELQKGFFCQNDSCKFAIWKNNKWWAAKKKQPTKAVVSALLNDGRVRVTGLYSEKTGKTYDATVVLEDDGQYANFKLEFDQRKGGSR